MYPLFIVLFIIFVLSLIFIDYKSFQLRNNNYWLISLIVINIILMMFYFIYYYKKIRNVGITGPRGIDGDIGPNGENTYTTFN